METKETVKKEYFDDINIEFTEEKYRKFICNVWRRFLNNDGYYLLMPINPLMNMESLEEYLESDSFSFRVISKEAVKNLPVSEIGFIVTIDWENEKELYMPDEFFKPKRIKARPNIEGVYSVNSGEGIVNGSFANAKTLAECLDIPFISFNKYDYDGFYDMDVNAFVREVITNYMTESNIPFSIELRDYLVKKYFEMITSTYKEQKESKTYNDEEFIGQINSFITAHENIKGLSL